MPNCCLWLSQILDKYKGSSLKIKTFNQVSNAGGPPC